MTGDPVYVKLTRPEGYEDACEQIVIEDAEIHPACMPEPATEEVERLRKLLTRMVLSPLAPNDHMTACDRVMGATHRCTCGADEARRELPQ